MAIETGNAVLRVQLVCKNVIRGVFTTKWKRKRILEAEFYTEAFTQLITLTHYTTILQQTYHGAGGRMILKRILNTCVWMAWTVIFGLETNTSGRLLWTR